MKIINFAVEASNQEPYTLGWDVRAALESVETILDKKGYTVSMIRCHQEKDALPTSFSIFFFMDMRESWIKPLQDEFILKSPLPEYKLTNELYYAKGFTSFDESGQPEGFQAVVEKLKDWANSLDEIFRFEISITPIDSYYAEEVEVIFKDELEFEISSCESIDESDDVYFFEGHKYIPKQEKASLVKAINKLISSRGCFPKKVIKHFSFIMESR